MSEGTVRDRVLPAVSWVAWVLAIVGFAAAVVLQQLNPPVSTTEAREPAHVTALWMSAWVGFGLVGALIISRRSDNLIGWILSAITFGMGLDQFASSYATYALVTAPGSVPLGSVTAWLGSWSGVPSAALIVLLVLVYPTGRPTGRLGRWLLRTVVTVAALQTVVHALRPGPIRGDTPPHNPLGIEALMPIRDATEMLGTALAVAALAAVIHAVVRFRRSSGVERQQFRWFIFAVATFPFLFQSAVLLEEFVLGTDGFDPVVPVIALMGNGLAAAIYIAISRHGLYEIDRVINRTVVYAVVTAVLVGAYVGLVFLLQPLLRPVAGSSDLAVAASTLAVAAAFGPVRRRVQSGVDRRFNRARYDATRTAESFAHRLRDELELDALTTEVREVVATTLRPRSVSLWFAASDSRA